MSHEPFSHFQLEDLLDRPPVAFEQKHISTDIFQRNMLVTGAAGSIGRKLCLMLCEEKPESLTLIDQSETALGELDDLIQLMHPAISVHAYIADIADTGRISSIFSKQKPDMIFHAAAYKHVPIMEKHPYEAIKTNFPATKSLADLAVKSGVKKFIFISTDKAINPAGVMGITKRLAELYLQNIQSCSTQFVTVRFGNVLGSAGSVTTIFERQLKAGGPLTVTHPNARRYFITAHEACQLVLIASSVGNQGDIMFLKMGEPLPILSIAQRMIQMHGYASGEDIPVVFTGLRPGEKCDEELWCDQEELLPTIYPFIHTTRSKIDLNAEFERLINLLRTRYQAEFDFAPDILENIVDDLALVHPDTLSAG